MSSDISCRAVIPVLKYAERQGITSDRLLSGLPLDRRFFESPDNWVPRDLMVELFSRMEALFEDPLIMFRVGMEGWQSQRGPYLSFVRFILDPSFLLKFASEMISLHASFFDLQIEQAGENELRFILTYSDNQLAHRHGCLFNLGWSAAFPQYVWNSESTVVEQQCVCPHELPSIERLPEKPEMIENVVFGADRCVHLLKWRKTAESEHADSFVRRNRELVENTLWELLRAESGTSQSSDRQTVDQFLSNLTEIDAVSPREKQIIRLVSLGKSNSQIASELFISPETVKKHLSNAFKKLGVDSRFELIARIYNYKN